MKTLFLCIACLAIFAGAAFAQTAKSPAGMLVTPDPAPQQPVDLDWNRNSHHPVQPVPEPGTMALASMGLIALGSAARKRRK